MSATLIREANVKTYDRKAYGKLRRLNEVAQIERGSIEYRHRRAFAAAKCSRGQCSKQELDGLVKRLVMTESVDCKPAFTPFSG